LNFFTNTKIEFERQGMEVIPNEIWYMILKPLAQSRYYAQIVRTCKLFYFLFTIKSKEEYLKFGFYHQLIDIYKEDKTNEQKGIWHKSYLTNAFWLNSGIDDSSWLSLFRTTLYYQDFEWRKERYEQKALQSNVETRIHFDRLQISMLGMDTPHYYLSAIFVVENHKPEWRRIRVYVHYTTDQWKTVQVVEARFCHWTHNGLRLKHHAAEYITVLEEEEKKPHKNKYDWKRDPIKDQSFWEWRINKADKEIWFAVQVQDTLLKSEYWDNNNGWNYRMIPNSIKIMSIEVRNPYCCENSYYLNKGLVFETL